MGNISAVRATLKAMSLALATGGWSQGEGSRYSAFDYISKTYRASNPERLPLPSVAAAAPLQRAAVVYLCCGDDEEFNELLRSLQLLQQFFIRRYPYPVYIMCDVRFARARVCCIVFEYLAWCHSSVQV